jgi:pimeloyl-ACP methyl ester carboxylesterase
MLDRFRAPLIRTLLVTAALLPAQVPAEDDPGPADWIGLRSASAQQVDEPVFAGKVMLYRAGKRDAEPIVLVHGIGQDGARDWRYVIQALAEDHDVWALDLPGFGASDKGNHLYSPDNYVRVLEAVVGRRVGRPFVLIGHSMGAAVSLDYAATYPKRVGRLVLVDMVGILHRSIYAEYMSRLGVEQATGFYPEESSWVGSVVRRMLAKVEPVASTSAAILRTPELRQRFLSGDPNAIAGYALVEHDFSRALRAVKAPTLLVWGSEDKVALLRAAQVARAIIPGARLKIIPGVRHEPMTQVPQRFNEIVRDELAGDAEGAAYAAPAGPFRSTRVGRCSGTRGRGFSGDYERIVLERCPDAEITNARVGTLVATDSTVRVLDSLIRDGVDATNSRIELTAGSVGGSPAFTVDGSYVDVAGTRVDGKDAIAHNAGLTPVTLRFSVAEVSRGGGAPGYVHSIVRIEPDKDW